MKTNKDTRIGMLEATVISMFFVMLIIIFVYFNQIGKAKEQIEVLENTVQSLELEVTEIGSTLYQTNLDIISISIDQDEYENQVFNDFSEMYQLLLDKTISNEELNLLVEEIVIKYMEVEDED